MENLINRLEAHIGIRLIHEKGRGNVHKQQVKSPPKTPFQAVHGEHENVMEVIYLTQNDIKQGWTYYCYNINSQHGDIVMKTVSRTK